MPEWNIAYVRGREYSVNPVKVSQDSLIAGTAEATHTPVSVKAIEGTELVKLILTPTENTIPYKDIRFIITGVLIRKDVTFISDDPVVRLSPLYMP